MIIGIENSPLVSSKSKIRGTGFYTKYLVEALQQYHPENKYVLFSGKDKITQKIDIFHYPYFEPFFLSLPFRKPGNTVVTIHDLTPLVMPKLFPSGIKGKFKFKIQKFLAKKTDAIITDSISSGRDIEKILGILPFRINPIYLAADKMFKKQNISDNGKVKILKKFRIPPKFALYVGDATPNKNLKRLVDAVTMASIPLVMAGGALAKKVPTNPWNKDLIYVQEKAKGSKNIHIIGYVSDEDLVTLYNLASVFVFPSLYEGFGLPLLEAGSCGCPIITSDGGSIPEVIGEAAKFVDPFDTKSIANGITDIFNDEKLQKEFSIKALNQSKKFSWKKTADETVKVYEKIHSKSQGLI